MLCACAFYFYRIGAEENHAEEGEDEGEEAAMAQQWVYVDAVMMLQLQIAQ